jgi:hypothetical protein
MPAVWIAAVALMAIAVTGLAVKFSALPAKEARALNPTSNKAEALAPNAEQRGRIRASLDALPLAFEANQGQANPRVRYTARGNGYSVFLTSNDAVFAIGSAKHSAVKPSRTNPAHGHPQPTEKVESASIDMHLVGGNSKAEIVAGNELPGIVNYYVGSDPKNWHTGVKQYSSVSYRDVYPGVNMVFHGAQRQLEFDFVVSPGADPKTIALGFKGARKLGTDASGNLVLNSSAGDVVLHKPVAYQEKDGKRQSVEAAFEVKNNQVGLNLGPYDRSRELVIDPTLTYATYLGGNGEDEVLGIAVDSSGNMYVTGQMNSSNFPTPSGPVSTSGNFDAFVTKISSSGAAIDFTTVLGGIGSDSGVGIAVSGSSVYVAGNTQSASFPSTVTLGPGGGQDAFVAALDSTTGAATGTNHYVTRIGGTNTDIAEAIAVDSSGDAYIGGETISADFPPVSALQTSLDAGDDGFIAKLNPAGSALLFSTFWGGNNVDVITSVALDNSNNVYVGGITSSTDFHTTSGVLQTSGKGGGDSFVSEIKSDGSAVVYSTYLSGSGDDQVLGIAVDSAGDVYVTGSTTSSDFPTANAVQSSLGGSTATNAFVTKLNPGATALLFSTYYGGALDDRATGIALDALGDAYITGGATSPTFPVVNSFQSALSGTADAFVTEFSNTGSVVYSSFYGGTGVENFFPGTSTALGGIAADANGNAYFAGNTNTTTAPPFPIVGGVQPLYGGPLADGFIAKVGPAPADFSVAVSPSSTSVSSGSTSSAITVTVSSVNSSFGQAVNLSCGGLPAKAVCHFSAASVTPGTSPQTSNLTIATNGASSASLELPGTKQHMRIFAAMFFPIFGVTLFGAGGTYRIKKTFGLLLLALTLVGLIILPACGGSSSNNGGGGGGGGTTPGTYNITVTGTAGGTTHSAPLILTVN